MPDRIRTLVFTTLYPNACQPRHGVFVEERLKFLVKTGEVEPTVVAPVPWFPSRHPRFGRYGVYARVPAREMRNGIEVLHPKYPVIPKVGMSIAPTLLGRSLYPVLRRLIREGHDFDLIDAHYLYPDGVAAAWLGRRLGKPVVLTARGTDVNLIPRHRGPRQQILWACAKAAAVITVSRALKDALVDLGVPAQKISVLRNGVDLETFQPMGRTAARKVLSLNGYVWLSVGHLVANKGHHIAIEAAAQEPGVTLLIIGAGPEEAFLRALARRLGVAERIRFVGDVDHAVLPTYYSAADVLVLASSREGMPNVVLEAIACATPVIATAIGGTPEVIASPEAGELMATRTAEATLNAWTRLRAHDHEPALTRRYAERFSWGATSRGQLALFKRFTGSPTHESAASVEAP